MVVLVALLSCFMLSHLPYSTLRVACYEHLGLASTSPTITRSFPFRMSRVGGSSVRVCLGCAMFLSVCFTRLCSRLQFPPHFVCLFVLFPLFCFTRWICLRDGFHMGFLLGCSLCLFVCSFSSVHHVCVVVARVL